MSEIKSDYEIRNRKIREDYWGLRRDGHSSEHAIYVLSCELKLTERYLSQIVLHKTASGFIPFKRRANRVPKTKSLFRSVNYSKKRGIL